MRRRRPDPAALAVLALLAAVAAAGTAGAQDAPEDTTAAPTGGISALADSLQAAGTDSLPTPPAGQPAGPQPLFFGCDNRPEAGIKAEVLKVSYYGKLSNSVSSRDGGRLSDTYDYSYDDYRKQDKTVERRSANASYSTGRQLPFQLNFNGRWDWSEDVTVNTAGRSNLNKRDGKSAGVDLTENDLRTWDVRHKFKAAARYVDQKSENQNQANNVSEGEFSGALRSGADLAESVTLATRLYGTKQDGNTLLGTTTSPSSTTGDTLGVGVYYDRELLAGTITVTQSAFDKRYLDFRRNSIGQIDTLNLAPGVAKIVQELEEKDALRLDWQNEMRVGRFTVTSDLARTVDQQSYLRSGVGRKEFHSENVDLALSFPVGVDSFRVQYRYEWSWDNQTYQGAESARGRQYTKQREAFLDWIRPLFRHTELHGKLAQTLGQDIAQFQHNDNDRDRLTSDASMQVRSAWPGAFSASLLFQYKAIEDINIRATKSANNNTKETFEVSPSYTWPLFDWLNLQQTYRLYIQFQDYDYSSLESVNKDDNYNKRGTVLTQVQVTPSDRLELTVKYDTSAKFNATRTRTDATGNDFYRRDQEQWTSRVDLGIVYRMVDWLTLEAATYRSKDVRDSFSGNTTQTRETYSGEVWLGAKIAKKWGRQNPLELAGRVKKYQAYGPNVTETNRDYWDADVTLKWSF